MTLLKHEKSSVMLASFDYDYGQSDQSIGQPLKITPANRLYSPYSSPSRIA